jgi:hypothetical protein
VRLDVHGAARLDERGDVGDRVTDAVAVTTALDVERLVEVHRPERVQRAEWDRRLVRVGEPRRACSPLGVRDHVLRKLERDAELAAQLGERCLDLRAFRREAERPLRHDLSLRSRVRSAARRTSKARSGARVRAPLRTNHPIAPE